MKSLEKHDSQRPSSDRRFLVLRAIFAALGALGVAIVPKVFSASPLLALGMAAGIATAVYLGCGSPLHRLASESFARRRLNFFALVSLASSVLYWYSMIISAGWVFVPRYFPLRWLNADLSIRTHFVESSVVVFAGLLLILRAGSGASRSRSDLPS